MLITPGFASLSFARSLQKAAITQLHKMIFDTKKHPRSWAVVAHTCNMWHSGDKGLQIFEFKARLVYSVNSREFNAIQRSSAQKKKKKKIKNINKMLKKHPRIGELAQWLKVPSDLTEDSVCSPNTQTKWRSPAPGDLMPLLTHGHFFPLYCPSPPLPHTHTHIHTHTHNFLNNKCLKEKECRGWTDS